MNKFRNFCLMILIVAGLFLFVGGGCKSNDSPTMCPDNKTECRTKDDCSNCTCEPGKVLVLCKDGRYYCAPEGDETSVCPRCWYPDGPFVELNKPCPCSPEHPCPPPQQCVDGVCQEGCDVDEDCGSDDKFCCGKTCCPKGYLCKDGECKPCPTSSCNGYCEEGVPHCADGSVPKDGTCSGCPALCPNGTKEECEVYGPQYTNCCNKVCCKTACNTDGTCPCTTPADCGGKICCSGVCCPAGQVCRNGNRCVDPDTPCDTDSECSGGVCCKDSAAAPKAGFCKAQCNCSAPSDCLSGVCCANKCCPKDHICINGKCVPCASVQDKCVLDICKKQHICKCKDKDGTIAPGNDPSRCPCTIASDCNGHDCCNGKCCAEGQRCNAYTHQCEQACDPNNPNCPSGKQCCRATNTCSQVCSCQTVADCPSGYACCNGQCCASGVCNQTNTGCGTCPQQCAKCEGGKKYCRNADGTFRESTTADCSDCAQSTCNSKPCPNDLGRCCDNGYCDENGRCQSCEGTHCVTCGGGKCTCAGGTESKTGGCCAKGGEAPLGDPNACCNGNTPYKPATGWASSAEEIRRQGCCPENGPPYTSSKNAQGTCNAGGCSGMPGYCQDPADGVCKPCDSF